MAALSAPRGRVAVNSVKKRYTLRDVHDGIMVAKRFQSIIISMRRYDVAVARARHILVNTREECEDLKKKIEEGADFEEMAKKHSSCPSGQRGGDLGEFGPGRMVKEFDDVVFKEQIGKTHGPVQTQFGFHLIQIVSRSD
jgi:peptidyl-prolyl cis-trans isomerase C